MSEGDLTPWKAFFLQFSIAPFLEFGPGLAEYAALHELDVIGHVRGQEEGDGLVISVEVVGSGDAEG